MKREFINKLLAMGMLLIPLSGFAQDEEIVEVDEADGPWFA